MIVIIGIIAITDMVVLTVIAVSNAIRVLAILAIGSA